MRPRSEHRIAFFISTGRCGTQWLAKFLGEMYSDLCRATHEPVFAEYEPKRMLRSADSEILDCYNRTVQLHVSEIWATVSEKTYIETGWPCYPALPMLIRQFGGALRLVHLVRHPVRAAMSMATHNVYARNDWIRKAAITPFDAGVVCKDWREGWEDMSAYEKCLFWWTEINLYALEVQERWPELDILFLRFEDLFGESDEALRGLVRHLGLPLRKEFTDNRSVIVDDYVFGFDPIDWKAIFRYDKTLKLTEKFGYQLSDGIREQLRDRYFSPELMRLRENNRGRMGKIVKAVRRLGRKWH